MYTIVEARGLSNIHDGREFIVPTDMGLRPPTVNNELFRVSIDNEEPHRVLPVSEDLAFSCTDCGSLFERTVVSHSIQWMFTAFRCPEHPVEAAYLDVFPKIAIDYGHDWNNAFMDLSTPDVSKGGIIQESLQRDEYMQMLRNLALGRAILKPGGLHKQHFRSLGMKVLQKAKSVSYEASQLLER